MHASGPTPAPAWEWRETARYPQRITAGFRGAALRITTRENRTPPSDSTLVQSLSSEELRMKEQLVMLQHHKRHLLQRYNELRAAWDQAKRKRHKAAGLAAAPSTNDPPAPANQPPAPAMEPDVSEPALNESVADL